MHNPSRTSVSIFLFLLVAVLAILVAPPARAHTGLETSDPPAEATVESADLTEVVLVFTKPIEVFDDSVIIEDADTRRVVPSSRSEDGLTVTATLTSPLAVGTWQVVWRVLAEDSHPRAGEFALDITADAKPSATGGPATVTPGDDANVGVGPTDATPPPTSSPSEVGEPAPTRAPSGSADIGWLERLSALSRIVFYLGLMTAVGVALFKAGPHNGQLSGALHLARWTMIAAGIALVAGVAEVVIHVAVVSGRGVAGLTDSSVWRAVLDTGLGTALWLRILGCGFLLWGGRRRTQLEQASSPDLRKLLGAGLAIASFQFVGHTASAAPPIIVRSADAAHAVAAAVWMGGLLGLAVVTRRGSRRTRAFVVGRFSSWATAAVVVVAIAGTALAVTNLPTISATWQTSYGRILMAKLLLVGGLAALGAHNHFRVVPRIVDGEDGHHALHELRRTVSVEIVLVVVIIALTALLVNTSPT